MHHSRSRPVALDDADRADLGSHLKLSLKVYERNDRRGLRTCSCPPMGLLKRKSPTTETLLLCLLPPPLSFCTTCEEIWEMGERELFLVRVAAPLTWRINIEMGEGEKGLDAAFRHME